MSSPSPAGPAPVDPEVFERRRTSFGSRAELYHRVRPGWPAEIVTWLLGTGRTSLDVLDVGCGTGLGALTAHTLGHRVVAVDSDAAMLNPLRRAVPQMLTVCAQAEELPLPSASMDAVMAVQCWHWFNETAVAHQCARVLRPGGTLGLGWHVDGSGTRWHETLLDIKGAAPAPTMPAGRPTLGERFTLVEQRDHHYEESITVDHLVDRASTWSYINVRDDAVQLLARLRAAAEHDANGQGVVALPGRAWLYRYAPR